MNDLFPWHGTDRLLPAFPVIFVFDQEADQHAWVHIFDVKAPETPSMVRIQFFFGKRVWTSSIRKRRTSVMRVEIKEVRPLYANKIVGRRWPASRGMCQYC